MKIFIGGDLVPTASNMAEFERGNTEALVDAALKALLDSAGYRMFNLEVPLTDEQTPIPKCGPNLIASTASAAGIQALGADFLTLANNHILDQGKAGLSSTVETLDRLKIAHAGTGESLEKAAAPYTFTLDGKTIGVYCCAEHEFSIATESSAGANPFDPLESPDHVAELKKSADYVIVLYHGGKEHYRYPSPKLQKVCRKLVDKGADLVICQHSHCIGCREVYGAGTIVYGQGNFLFDDCEDECWQTGLLVCLDTAQLGTVDYIPLEKRGCSVALAGENAAQILEGFYARSEEIRKDGFIASTYEKVAAEEYERYMNMLQGGRYEGLAFRAINKLCGHRLKPWIMRRFYGTEEAKAKLINVMDCEVHRECFLYALKK